MIDGIVRKSKNVTFLQQFDLNEVTSTAVMLHRGYGYG